MRDIKLRASYFDEETFRQQILKPELNLAGLSGTAERTNNSCIRAIKFANI